MTEKMGLIAGGGSFPLLFAASCPLLGWPLGQLWPLQTFAAAMAVLVVVRHRANIGRLLNGTENKIGTPRPADHQ